MRKLRTFELVTILLATLGLSGCGAAALSTQSLVHADDLKKAVKKFEETRTETASAISSRTQRVIGELETEAPNLSKAADDWALAWSEVNEQVGKLTTDFEAIATSAEKYFQELESHANQIKNPTLQQAEHEKYRLLRANWNKEYAVAAENIGKLRNVEADGSDFQHILIGAAMRDRIQHNINELREISKQANNLLTELAKLTAEGQKLVNTVQ